MIHTEALKLALEALEGLSEPYYVLKAQDALRTALEQPEPFQPDWDRIEPLQEALREHMAEIHRLRAALEQHEQEPVAWMYVGLTFNNDMHGPHLVWKPEHMDAMSAEKGVVASPLFTHPPRREWRGLTDEEIWKLYYDERVPEGERCDRVDFARAVEAALKERNA